MDSCEHGRVLHSMENYSIPPVSSWFDDRDWTTSDNLNSRNFSDASTVDSQSDIDLNFPITESPQISCKLPEESIDTYIDFFASNRNTTEPESSLPPLVCPVARRPVPSFLDAGHPPGGNEPHTFLAKNDSHPVHPSDRQDPHSKQKRPHKCNVCGKRFPRPGVLKAHLLVHEDLKAFRCLFPGCKQTFGTLSNRTRHLKTVHRSEGKKLIKLTKTSRTPCLPLENSPDQTQWIPTSLITRLNVASLKCALEDDTDLEDGEEEEEVSTDGWDVHVSIPLPLVMRTLVLREDEEGYEERDSYSQAPLYPYHPTQFRGLPGPIVASHLL